MGVRLRKGALILTPDDLPELAEWMAQHDGQVFKLKAVAGGGAHLRALGPQDEACRTSINITSKAPGDLKLISNFAPTPFELDGRAYGSVEAFWQGLKFPDEAQRRELAPLWGAKAKDAGYHAPKSDILVYEGETVRVGAFEHWRLLERAIAAKFEQNADARRALLATGERPLTHQMKNDSRTIPGVVLAEIWMRRRQALRAAQG